MSNIASSSQEDSPIQPLGVSFRRRVKSGTREWLRVWWKYFVIPFCVIAVLLVIITAVLVG